MEEIGHVIQLSNLTPMIAFEIGQAVVADSTKSVHYVQTVKWANDTGMEPTAEAVAVTKTLHQVVLPMVTTGYNEYIASAVRSLLLLVQVVLIATLDVSPALSECCHRSSPPATICHASLSTVVPSYPNRPDSSPASA